jgi:hypothetical protein
VEDWVFTRAGRTGLASQSGIGIPTRVKLLPGTTIANPNSATIVPQIFCFSIVAETGNQKKRRHVIKKEA